MVATIVMSFISLSAINHRHIEATLVVPLSPLCSSFFWRASGDCTGSLSCSMDAHHADDQIPSFHSNTVSSLIAKSLFLSSNIRPTFRSSFPAVSPLFGLMAPSPSYSVLTPVNQIKLPLSTHMSVSYRC
ncbi:hypothetical protein CSKR_201500 [Clonorchis sinensis]|uniref:Uncharacterized protein n=1 Tax=Clonorchis sinensis TaxID=79923 RepID=A0A8T1MSI6_CLOSI|nr:hypothetical protein CSKR_201500 [Clonorchis sinensis]